MPQNEKELMNLDAPHERHRKILSTGALAQVDSTFKLKKNTHI